jgi:hypothetical protein
MPKRVIDFDALWGSDKIAACAEWAQAEYAWLYGLADASGCFELTNLRVIWGRVAAIRRNLTIERLEQIFDEFQEKGLLFVWEENGKRYGHWTGSDVPGRLPAPSWRVRLERLAPPVPRAALAEFMARFARGRAASPGGGFFSRGSGGEAGAPAELKPRLESAQGQDWNWNRNSDVEGKVGGARELARGGGAVSGENLFFISNSQLKNTETAGEKASVEGPLEVAAAAASAASGSALPSTSALPAASVACSAPPRGYIQNKAAYVERELAVGMGPRGVGVSVKAEALERIRARDGGRGS